MPHSRVRGISPVVAVAILILVAIIAGVAIWYQMQKYKAGENVMLQAYKIQNKYVSGKQIVVVGLRITPQTDRQLTISEIKSIITFSDGTVETVSYTPGTGWGTSTNLDTTSSSISGAMTLNPGTSTELTITLVPSAGQIVSVSFQVTFTDPAGNTYTFSSNEVSLS